jgi:hypothetical protein
MSAPVILHTFKSPKLKFKSLIKDRICKTHNTQYVKKVNSNQTTLTATSNYIISIFTLQNRGGRGDKEPVAFKSSNVNDFMSGVHTKASKKHTKALNKAFRSDLPKP